jgi:predicted NUDIX family NTP pyrophosphohydrolase
MMKTSAGILLYRGSTVQDLEVLLVHPGGPFWTRKEDAAWSIPKGEVEEADPFAAALREFEEEIGFRPEGRFVALTPVRQSSGKTVIAWAVEGECDVSKVKSNTFAMEWPRGSGRMQEFPEIERAEWFSLGAAEGKILKGQLPLLRDLAAKVCHVR